MNVDGGTLGVHWTETLGHREFLLTQLCQVQSDFKPAGLLPSTPSTSTPDIYLLGVRGGLQGAVVVRRVHHGHVGAAVVQHLLHAVDAAALAARADRGAGDGVVAAQAVHLTAGRLAVLQVSSHKHIRKHFLTQMNRRRSNHHRRMETCCTVKDCQGND